MSIVCIYRSKSDTSLSSLLEETIPSVGPCLVVGDMNICTKAHPKHHALIKLRKMGFTLLNSEATHVEGGHIDQAWIRGATGVCNVALYCPYYTCKDHDGLLFTNYEPTT